MASTSGGLTGHFSPSTLEKKLRELNTTLQSIQGVSQWLVHYRKHAKAVTNVWYKELHKGAHLVPCCVIDKGDHYITSLVNDW